MTVHPMQGAGDTVDIKEEYDEEAERKRKGAVLCTHYTLSLHSYTVDDLYLLAST